MAECLASQPSGFNGSNVYSLASSHPHQYSTPTSTRNTSSPPSTEHYHLYPNTTAISSRYWLSGKASPLWLQYLSALLSQSLKDPAPFSSHPSHSSCAILRLRRTASSTPAARPSLATCKPRFRTARCIRSSLHSVGKSRQVFSPPSQMLYLLGILLSLMLKHIPSTLPPPCLPTILHSTNFKVTFLEHLD